MGSALAQRAAPRSRTRCSAWRATAKARATKTPRRCAPECGHWRARRALSGCRLTLKTAVTRLPAARAQRAVAD